MEETFSTQEKVLKAIINMRPQLISYLTGIVGNFDDAEDIFQDCCITIFRKWEQIKDGGSVSAWSREIARRTALQWLRERNKTPLPIEDQILEQICFSEEPEAGKEDYITALKACMIELPDHSRNLLIMRYTQGLSCLEISKELQRSVDGLYVTLSKLRSILKRCIKQKIDIITEQ